MIPNKDRLRYHSNLRFTPGPWSVTILDESDEHVFNDPSAFMKFSRKTQCICLTATCAESVEGGLERQVLESMEFKIFEDLLADQPILPSKPLFE